MMKKILTLGLVLGFLGGCSDMRSDEVFRVGAILPLTGDLAVVGEKLQKGMEMAKVDFLTKHPERQIEIDYQDGGFDSKKAVTAAHFLLGTQGSEVILGPFGPDQALAVAPVVKNLAPKTPVVAMSMCNPSMEGEENLFCVFPGSAAQADVVIDEFLKNGVKKVAIVAQSSEPTTEMLKRFQERMGDKIGVIFELSPDETDFKTVVTKVKETNPDAIFYSIVPPFPFAKKMHEQGLGDILTFVWMEGDEEELAKGPEFFEGQLTAGAPEISEWFVERFARDEEGTPDMYYQIAYDAAMSVFLALDEGGDVTENLKKVEMEETALPGFWFGDDRKADEVKIGMMVIQNGKYVVIEN